MLALAPLNVDILPDDCAVLKGLLVKLHAQYGAAIEAMHQQILKLRHAQFGASSERLSTQTDLFAEILDWPLPPVVKQKISYERQRKGRPALPKDLPRQRIEYHLDDQQMAEFDSVKPIGEEVSETLQYTPARLVVLEHARIKYACTKDGQSTVRTAYAQPSPLPKCNADASLLAQILTATFADHVPLNRQSMIFGRHGFPVPRSTLDDWKLGSAELLEVLRAPLIAHTLSAPRLHSDDTTVQLRDASKDTTHTSRLWAYLGAGQRQDDQGQWVEHPPSVVFEFTRTRQGIHPQRFLKDYRGYLQIDAYSGYDALLKSGDIVAVGCMAHTRRHFFEVARKVCENAPMIAASPLCPLSAISNAICCRRGAPSFAKILRAPVMYITARPARHAYCSSGRSASKMGSSTSIAAVPLSPRVEIPSGLSLPLAFGVNTRLIGSG